MTTGKTIALTRQNFVGKVMSLIFNMLSRLVTTFLPRSKCLLISWLQSPSAVILEPPKIKSDTVSTVCPSICHEVIGLDAMILVFWMLSFKPTFSLSSFTFMYWRRKWQPTPVFLPGESHGRRSLVGYSPQGRKESDTTERVHFSSLHSSCTHPGNPSSIVITSSHLRDFPGGSVVKILLFFCRGCRLVSWLGN